MKGKNKTRRYSMPYRLLIFATVSIFVTEAFVMLLLFLLPSLPIYMEAFLDALLLIILILPTLYFFLFRPMILYISERTTEELRGERDKAQKYLDIAGVMFVAINAEEEVTLVNQKGCDILGYEQEEIIGKNWFDNFLPASIREEVRTVFQRLMAGEIESVEYYENPILTKDNEKRIILWHNTILKDEAGNIISTLGSGEDITERKQAEERQKLATKVLELLNESGEDIDIIRGILLLIKDFTGFEAVGIRLREGEDFPYYEANGFPPDFLEAERYLCARDQVGKIRRDSEGNPVLECMCGNVICRRTNPSLPFFTEGGSFWTNSTTELLASTTEEDRQSRTRNRCHGEGYESVALIPLRSNSEIIGLLQLNDSRKNMFTLEMINFFEEIGDSIGIALASKQAQKRISFLARVLETSPLSVIATDVDGKIIYINPATETLFGYENIELIGQNPIIFNAESNAREVQDEIFDTVNEGRVWRGEILNRKKNGEIFSIQTSVYQLLDEKGDFIALVGFQEDISERKRMEEALRKSEEEFRELYDNAPVGYHEIDVKGNIVRSNQTEADILGYTREGILGCSIFDFVTETEREIARESVRQKIAQQQPIQSFERTYVRKDGREIQVALEERLIFDEQKRVIGIRSTLQDITERKQMEEEREKIIKELEAKNTELEQFTYTVSHDLKSPLFTIKGFLGLLEKDSAAGDTEQMKTDITYISDAVGKMQQLLDELLELSRIGRLMNPPEEVPLDGLVRKAMNMVAGRLAERDVKVEIAPNLPVVYGDSTRLREVLENLVDNAAKFMGDQTDPRVEIGVRRDGEETVFYVRDNGVGIEPRYHEKIFGLFDKLDKQTEGTGAGLAIVKRIVEVHGGRIWVESEGTGKGSAFCFTLPDKVRQ